MLGAAGDDGEGRVRGCPECAVADGERTPAGGVAEPLPGLLVHAVLGGSPLAGWMVVAPRRHVEHLADLSAGEMGGVAELARRVAELQRRLLGAQKSYVALFAEVVPHLHFHLIPRYVDTPAELRGPRAFQAPAAAMRPEEELAAVAARLLAPLAP